MCNIPVLNEICSLTAENKLVPFLGAGCSKAILNCDWDALMQKLTIETVAGESNPEIAQNYVDKFGKDSLTDILRQHLYISTFDPIKGYAHIAVMASMSNVIYTTNQDNVMEKCLEFYGRKIYPVVSLDDLIQSAPDGMLYIKFHGDLSDPDSIVFTSDDYHKRMTEETFLDIRLKSDLLGKRFLFMGYSFRDDNIRLIFDYLHEKFPDKLAKSYLIAYSSDPQLMEACEKYSISAIIPSELYPDLSAGRAFEKLLYEWNRDTFRLREAEQCNALFNPTIPPHKHVVAPIEVEMLEDIIDRLPLLEAIKKFRYLLERAEILAPLEENVIQMFMSLCIRCEAESETKSECATQLEGASFNLIIKEPALRFKQAVYSLLLVNFRKDTTIPLSPSMYKGFPMNISIILGAFAIDEIRENNITITNIFPKALSIFCDRSIGYRTMAPEAIRFMEEQYDWLWKNVKTSYENPLRRQDRLHISRREETQYPGFDDILRSLMAQMPVRGFKS